jgi:hypothetical protein
MITDQAADGSLLSQHAVHLLSVGIPVLLVVLGLAVDSIRKTRARAGQAKLAPRPLFVAASACVGAALIHAYVMPEHFRESLLYGAFVAALAAGQVVAAWLVAVGRSRAVVVAVALGSAAVICLWLATRVVAIPLGPSAGATETFGALDVAASVFELLAVVGCMAALRSPTRRRVTHSSAPMIREQVLVP